MSSKYVKVCTGSQAQHKTWWWHDDIIKWKHFPRYRPFVRVIHRSSVNSPHKGQWRGALMFSVISARINGWVNNGEAGEAGDLICHRAYYDVPVMEYWLLFQQERNLCWQGQHLVHYLNELSWRLLMHCYVLWGRCLNGKPLRYILK